MSWGTYTAGFDWAAVGEQGPMHRMTLAMVERRNRFLGAGGITLPEPSAGADWQRNFGPRPDTRPNSFPAGWEYVAATGFHDRDAAPWPPAPAALSPYNTACNVGKFASTAAAMTHLPHGHLERRCRRQVDLSRSSTHDTEGNPLAAGMTYERRSTSGQWSLVGPAAQADELRSGWAAPDHAAPGWPVIGDHFGPWVVRDFAAYLNRLVMQRSPTSQADQGAGVLYSGDDTTKNVGGALRVCNDLPAHIDWVRGAQAASGFNLDPGQPPQSMPVSQYWEQTEQPPPYPPNVDYRSRSCGLVRDYEAAVESRLSMSYFNAPGVPLHGTRATVGASFVRLFRCNIGVSTSGTRVAAEGYVHGVYTETHGLAQAAGITTTHGQAAFEELGFAAGEAVVFAFEVPELPLPETPEPSPPDTYYDSTYRQRSYHGSFELDWAVPGGFAYQESTPAAGP